MEVKEMNATIAEQEEMNLSDKRIQSKIKLKMAFEDIYTRYSKDFPEVK